MSIVAFLILLGMTTALLTLSGGTRAFAEWAQTRIKSKRGAKLLAACLGVFIFVDDYFNRSGTFNIWLGGFFKKLETCFKDDIEMKGSAIDHIKLSLRLEKVKLEEMVIDDEADNELRNYIVHDIQTELDNLETQLLVLKAWEMESL